MDSLLSINPGLAIWTVVSFLIFVLILRKVAWGPILKALERREDRIAAAIETAEKNRAESEENLVLQREELKKAREEARAIVGQATGEARKQGEETLREARKGAEDLLERARADIRSEEARAIENVRREAVTLALEAAERLIRRELRAEDHRRLVEEFIADAAKASGERDS